MVHVQEHKREVKTKYYHFLKIIASRPSWHYAELEHNSAVNNLFDNSRTMFVTYLWELQVKQLVKKVSHGVYAVRGSGKEYLRSLQFS